VNFSLFIGMCTVGNCLTGDLDEVRNFVDAQQFGQVTWLLCGKSIESDDCQFEVDTIFDWQPVQPNLLLFLCLTTTFSMLHTGNKLKYNSKIARKNSRPSLIIGSMVNECPGFITPTPLFSVQTQC